MKLNCTRFFIDYLFQDTSSTAGRSIYELVWDGLSYLDTRTEFWRQQKPLYARKRDRVLRTRAAGDARGDSPQHHIIKELETIDHGTKKFFD